MMEKKQVVKDLLITLSAFVIGVTGCSKLNENFQGDISQGQVSSGTVQTASLLQGLYSSMELTFTSHLFVFPLNELTTDAAIAPTRGADWDDNGMWRSFHQQKWMPNNERIKECFNRLSGIIYAATDLLRYNPTEQEAAEARFIRAWVMYLLLDMFDQVPYRDPGEDVLQPARIRKGMAALDYIIGEVSAIEKNLPILPPYVANQNAAKFLLMKCNLNKSVYANRADPSFTIDNMNNVIHLADDIINSTLYSLAANYFDNFAPDNTNIGKENIFTQQNRFSQEYLTWFAWAIPFHYNQAPAYAAFNGWATLSDYYDKFETGDKRRGMVYTSAGAPANPGKRINVGLLVGQQYDYQTDFPLKDRHGAPLSFTRQVNHIETGYNLEITGIRPIKYFPDWPNYFTPSNDFVYFRFSDVLLMKAEALLRGGVPTNAGSYGNSPESLVNAVRTHPSRGASPMTTVTIETLLEERGRELWWEGWRRQDMIRFKKFLLPFQEKTYSSDPKYLVFPIPDEQLAVNPNLHQNPGY